MKLGSALLREKTNVGLKTSTTFNAPGQYIPPYGKTTVRIEGRGASGNYSSGGTYAGEAYGGESYVGTNPTTYPYAGYTPPQVFYSGTNPGTNYFAPPHYTANPTGEGWYWPGGFFYDPGTAYYYTEPGTAYYNTEPGTAYYSPYYSAYYNPYYPGNAGTPSVIGGVYFPAGNSDSLASLVPTTTTNLGGTTGIYVAVPIGGYINIQNV